MSSEYEEKELTLDGEGQITFRLISRGRLEIEMFNQRIITDTFDVHERNQLAAWLVSSILQVSDN